MNCVPSNRDAVSRRDARRVSDREIANQSAGRIYTSALFTLRLNCLRRYFMAMENSMRFISQVDVERVCYLTASCCWSSCFQIRSHTGPAEGSTSGTSLRFRPRSEVGFAPDLARVNWPPRARKDHVRIGDVVAAGVFCAKLYRNGAAALGEYAGAVGVDWLQITPPPAQVHAPIVSVIVVLGLSL